MDIPFEDLPLSTDLFPGLGSSFKPKCTDGITACLIIGENIAVMLVPRLFFKTLMPKEVSEATRSAADLVWLPPERVKKADDIVSRANSVEDRTGRCRKSRLLG